MPLLLEGRCIIFDEKHMFKFLNADIGDIRAFIKHVIRIYLFMAFKYLSPILYHMVLEICCGQRDLVGLHRVTHLLSITSEFILQSHHLTPFLIT